MDEVTRLIRDNAGIVGAVIGFVAAQVALVWRDRQVERRAIAAEKHADARALRDARLVRLRAAFEPVILAAWGLRRATSELFYSRSGDVEQTVEEVLKVSSAGVNEARVKLRLEDDVQDVFDELSRIRQGFEAFAEGTLVKTELKSADEMKRAWADVTEGVPRLEKMVAEHLRRIERSV